ncbi:MAG: SMC-Scp complex subunit ScpB [Bacilli bacterium]|nr:SMC-Scp complex subunit ScpB [Bacilli bacterium]
MNKKAILEGLFFVMGDDGVSLKQIEEVLEIDEDKANSLLAELKKDLVSDDRGLTIEKLGNKYKMTTKSEHKEYYKKIVTDEESNTLSQAALETLAIIAYNEPITRIDVDKLRGVSSSQMLRKLVAKGLIEDVGRSDQPGRPYLYSTTDLFLDYFKMSSKSELPSIDEYLEEEEETEESDLYTAKYREEEVL